MAEEFNGRLDSAGMIFKRFSSLMQAGPFIRRAWQHQEFISLLKDTNLSLYEREMNYLKIAVNYRSLGYRNQAIRMLEHAIKADSTFGPAYINLAIYTFQQGDTLLARKYLKKSQVLEPFDNFANSFSTLMEYLDTLRRRPDKEMHLKVVGTYLSMGFYENAADELIRMSAKDSTDIVPLKLLGSLMETLRRYAPAIR